MTRRSIVLSLAASAASGCLLVPAAGQAASRTQTLRFFEEAQVLHQLIEAAADVIGEGTDRPPHGVANIRADRPRPAVGLLP